MIRRAQPYTILTWGLLAPPKNNVQTGWLHLEMALRETWRCVVAGLRRSWNWGELGGNGGADGGKWGGEVEKWGEMGGGNGVTLGVM